MNRKQTKSTRRNTTSNHQFQQLAFDRGKDKKQSKKNSKKSIEAQTIKMQQENQNVQISEEKGTKNLQPNSQINQTQFQPIKNKKNVIQKQSANKKINQHSNNKAKLSLHHQAILTILKQLQSHPTYSILTKTRLRPSTKTQVQQINQKLNNKEYNLDEFSADICKIFVNFHEKSGLSHQILQKVQYLHVLLVQKIGYFSKNYQDIVESSQANSLSLRRSARSSKSISKNIRYENYFTPKKRPSNRQKFSTQKQSASATITEQPKKKNREERKKIAPRPKNSEITLQQIANIGFNIRKLQSKDLQQICLTYCSDAHERTHDLQKLQKPVLFQIQAHIKTILKQRNMKYQQIRQQQDQNFVIQDDD